jgi:hypothetical protein
MNKIVPGIIVTTLAVYVWGFLFWGASTIPYSGWKQTTDDEQTQKMLSKHFPESGVYFVPGFDHEPEELERLFKQGPTGFVTIDLDGRSQTDPVILVGGFVLTVLIVSLMAVMFHVAGAREFRDFARLSLVAGTLAVVAIDGGDLVWWQAPIEWKVWQIIYDFTVFLVAGHLLGIFMKRTTDPEA